jgi:hypothetical protein
VTVTLTVGRTTYRAVTNAKGFAWFTGVPYGTYQAYARINRHLKFVGNVEVDAAVQAIRLARAK